MLDLSELEQLVSFAKLGTLSRVAETFHISTPSVTRSMQHVERDFGVTLFDRGKNKIELNEMGEAAVEQARKLLDVERQAVEHVRQLDERRRTIVVKSCAPAPLWELQHSLRTKHPNMTLSTQICTNEQVLTSWEAGECDVAILPFPTEGAEPFMDENLYVCVPPTHELASHETLSWHDIDGFNFLLATELGFWDAQCREKMPASKFLVQTDSTVFNEIVAASTLPCFTTDYNRFGNSYPNRVNIPLDEPEVHVTFWVARRKSARK